jgi:hypothetical protein
MAEQTLLSLCLVPGPDCPRALVSKRSDYQAIRAMEPTGIEPVTSCLQSAWDEARRCSETPVYTGLWPNRRLKADAQDASKSERFRAPIGRWRPMAMLDSAA